MKYWIIGIFECGCQYEASLSSVEVVKCDTDLEINDILSRMSLHSEDYQCTPTGASQIMIFHGRPIAGGIPKQACNYKSYVKKWNKRHSDNIKEQKRYLAWLKRKKLFYPDVEHDKQLPILIKRLESWKAQ